MVRQIVATDDDQEILVEIWEDVVRISTRPVKAEHGLRVWSPPMAVTHDSEHEAKRVVGRVEREQAYERLFGEVNEAATGKSWEEYFDA